MSGNSYNSIKELPMWNWWMLKETGDINYLKVDFNKPSLTNFKELVVKFEQEYLDLFGAGDEAEKLMQLLKRKIKHQADYLLGKKYTINYIKSIDFQLEMMGQGQGGKKQTLEEINAIVSKFMGYRVDPKIESVVQYKAYLNALENNNKQMAKDGK